MMKRFGREHRRYVDGVWPSGRKESIVLIFGEGRKTSSTSRVLDNSGQGPRHRTLAQWSVLLEGNTIGQYSQRQTPIRKSPGMA